MLGAIIGDIVGSRFEFGGRPEEDFELFTGDCGYTDDTICTIAIADAVLSGKSYRDSLLSWCRRYPDPKGGYGNMFRHWIESSNPLPQNSCGNGAAMRVSPVGWLFGDYNSVMEEAKRSAEVSHCHSEGVKGAQCVATLIYWLRTCRLVKDDLESAVSRNFGYVIPSLRDIYKIGGEGHFDAVCQETVPYAIRCFLDANDFEETLRNAVMARGDTDTKAAIACSLAEACYEIPDALVDRAYSYLPDEMLEVIEHFYSYLQENLEE